MVTVEGGYTKNGQTAIQPLPTSIIPRLRQFLAGKTGQLWPGTWRERAAKMLRADLAAAGIPYRTEDGYADFHCLRHSYVSMLAANGTPIKTAMELARHSDVNLTMAVYSHASLHDVAGAVERLPCLLDVTDDVTGASGQESRSA